MIKVMIYRDGDDIRGFEISGHALYGAHGKDIVCASVSSAAYMTANTVTDIIGAEAECAVDESGYMKVLLKSTEQSALDIMKGFELHVRCLSEEYPDNLNVTYGGVK